MEGDSTDMVQSGVHVLSERVQSLRSEMFRAIQELNDTHGEYVGNKITPPTMALLDIIEQFKTLYEHEKQQRQAAEQVLCNSVVYCFFSLNCLHIYWKGCQIGTKNNS